VDVHALDDPQANHCSAAAHAYHAAALCELAGYVR
jgi:hypothetical protein